MIVYAKRENLFEKTERRWAVEPEGLRQVQEGGPGVLMPWSAVREIRLTYAPTRAKTWRHKLTLRVSRGSWVIDNVHFAGIGSFEDRSASFGPFVLACVEHVRDAAPGAVARLGSDPLAYWAQMGFVTVMFVLLAAVVVALPVNFTGLIWVKLGLIAVMLPVLAGFMVKSWPRTTTLDPEAFRAALPKVPH